MDFTVIIPSRNRPVLLRKAIDSVLMQTHQSVEILVVNDGSDGENEQAYALLAHELNGRVRFLNLEKSKNGHGPSFAINRGAEQALGDFLCFLDDDDLWTDRSHLDRAKLVVSSRLVDMYLTNQVAYAGESPIQDSLWLQIIAERVRETHMPDEHGTYDVTLADLMTCDSFPHLNNTIVRRKLYLDVGGMDEAIRYECEWDLYFRLLDKVQGIKYFTGIVSRHNVPDKSKTINASTAVSEMQKLLLRSYVMDKALLFTHSTLIMRVARRNKMYTLKKIAVCLAKAGKHDRALMYAKQASTFAINAKWRVYSLYLSARTLLSHWW